MTVSFGVAFPGFSSRQALVASAQRAEELGYTLFQISDHTTGESDPVVTLATAALATKHLRIGSFVFNNDFRHPFELARAVKSLDEISGGRFQLGIGAGYLPSDYQQLGIPFDPFSVRMERMLETITIIKQYCSAQKVDFIGKHYSVHIEGHAATVQQPCPPIYIGGGGKRILSVAAKVADIVGLTAVARPEGKGFDLTSVTPHTTTQKLGWISEAKGERQPQISCFAFIVDLSAPRAVIAESLASRTDLTVEQIAGSPHFLIGTIDEVCENILFYQREYHIDSYTVRGDALETLAPVVKYFREH